jgi:hypothetical protein
MLFMTVATWKTEDRDAILKRRAEKGAMIPEGVKLIGEWVGGPYVVRVFETDKQEAITLGTLAWSDIMDVRTYPAMESENVMKLV